MAKLLLACLVGGALAGESSGIVGDCLGDALCTRRLSRALSAGNATNGTSAPPSPPPFDLTVPAVDVLELAGPGEPVPVIGDVMLGAFTGIRGILSYDPDISLDAYSTYAFPLFAQAAMIAWANDVVFPAPAVKSNHTIQLIFGDQCADFDLRFDSPKCMMPYNVHLLSDMFQGRPDLPPCRAVVGAGLFTDQLAHFAALENTPMVGFVAGEDGLSDKKVYPSFVRVNQPNLLLFRISAVVLEKLGFTIFDSFFCDVGEAQTLVAASGELYNSMGVKTNAYIVKPFQYTGSPPGHPADLAYLTWKGVPEESTQKEAHFKAIITAALNFNAHAHQNFMALECAVYDVFNTFAVQGLVGAGHFWTGRPPTWSIYGGSYMAAVTAAVPVITKGIKSPFRFEKPFDGAVFLDASNGLTERQIYKDFLTLVAYVGKHSEDYLPTWLQGAYPEEAFDNTDSALWRKPSSIQFVDALMTILYATNECLVKYGTSFTNEQLMEEVKNLDFEGASMRIRFDGNGDAITTVAFVNSRVPSDWTEMKLGGYPRMDRLWLRDSSDP